MALAHLCSKLKRYGPAKALFDFEFQALIVDHGAREGSAEEAERLRLRLKLMGKYMLDRILFDH